MSAARNTRVTHAAPPRRPDLSAAVAGATLPGAKLRDEWLHFAHTLADAAHALLAPMIFLALHQHSVGACPVQGAQVLDPERMLRVHLDLALRGLEARVDEGGGKRGDEHAGLRADHDNGNGARP